MDEINIQELIDDCCRVISKLYCYNGFNCEDILNCKDFADVYNWAMFLDKSCNIIKSYASLKLNLKDDVNIIFYDLKQPARGKFDCEHPDKIYISNSLLPQYNKPSTLNVYLLVETIVHELIHKQQYELALKNISNIKVTPSDTLRLLQEGVRNEVYWITPTEQEAKLKSVEIIKELIDKCSIKEYIKKSMDYIVDNAENAYSLYSENIEHFTHTFKNNGYVKFNNDITSIDSLMSFCSNQKEQEKHFVSFSESNFAGAFKVDKSKYMFATYGDDVGESVYALLDTNSYTGVNIHIKNNSIFVDSPYFVKINGYDDYRHHLLRSFQILYDVNKFLPSILALERFNKSVNVQLCNYDINIPKWQYRLLAKFSGFHNNNRVVIPESKYDICINKMKLMDTLSTPLIDDSVMDTVLPTQDDSSVVVNDIEPLSEQLRKAEEVVNTNATTQNMVKDIDLEINE